MYKSSSQAHIVAWIGLSLSFFCQWIIFKLPLCLCSKYVDMPWIKLWYNSLQQLAEDFFLYMLQFVNFYWTQIRKCIIFSVSNWNTLSYAINIIFKILNFHKKTFVDVDNWWTMLNLNIVYFRLFIYSSFLFIYFCSAFIVKYFAIV